jgi:hypothetical protein
MATLSVAHPALTHAKARAKIKPVILVLLDKLSPALRFRFQLKAQKLRNNQSRKHEKKLS